MKKRTQGFQFDFYLDHRTKLGNHFIKFIPVIANEGFKPKEIEVSQQQWDELRFHFGIGRHPAVEGDEHLCYIN